MNAEILAVGTELLLGDITNTNARYISNELAALGINVYFQTVVGDNAVRLKQAFEIAFGRAELVIVSGGLGPTEDDLTKETAAAYFKRPLLTHKESLERLENYFVKRDIPMPLSNTKQAEIPEGAVVLKNDNGTAPGVWLEQDGKTIVLLPGPPSELEPMFKFEVLPKLKEKQEGALYSRTLKMFGAGESAVETELKDLIDAQTNPTIATYAGMSEVKVRLTARAGSAGEARELINPVAEKIYERLGGVIYGEGDDTLESTVAKKLADKGLRLAAAESCTGGKLTAALVSVPGISDVLLEGIVSYSNEAKVKRLGVKPETLAAFGAVSKETAMEMAEGAAKFSGADVAVSTTGIAGPGGGTEEKPVGLVYIGLYIKGELFYRECRFNGNRESVRNRAVVTALGFMLKNI